MWTSQQSRQSAPQEGMAQLGAVTLGGDPAGVSIGGERRWLPVYTPGGYSWRPAAGDRVLVLKAGAEGESPCILGTLQQGGELEPGEIRLSGPGCALKLKGGVLELEGTLKVNGVTLEQYIRQVAGSMG